MLNIQQLTETCAHKLAEARALTVKAAILDFTEAEVLGVGVHIAMMFVGSLVPATG